MPAIAFVVTEGDLRKLGRELQVFRVLGISNDDKLCSLLSKVFFDATFLSSPFCVVCGRVVILALIVCLLMLWLTLPYLLLLVAKIVLDAGLVFALLSCHFG